MPLNAPELTRSTMSRCSTTSTSTATPWPTADLASVVWECLSETIEKLEEQELGDHQGGHRQEQLTAAAASWLDNYAAAYLLLKRVVSVKAEAKSHRLLWDLASDEAAPLFALGTAPATLRRATGMQAVAWHYLESIALAEPEAPERYPLLRAALDAGRVVGAGLPTPGRRPLRIVEEDDTVPVDEQVRFGMAGMPPADHMRRRQLR
jgi:hypothetical protein